MPVLRSATSRLASVALLAVLLPVTATAVPPAPPPTANTVQTPQGTEVTPDHPERSAQKGKQANIRFHMDFDKVDILEVVKAIAQWTRKNFILPDNVRGKITIIGPTDVSADEAYKAFIAALDTNNLSLVPTGGEGKIPTFYKIMPKKDSIRGNIPTDLPSEHEPLPLNEQMATKMFRLRYSEADPIKNIISQFITRDGEVISYPPDVLIVSDMSTNILRVERFIKALDLPGSQDEVNVIQCYHASAQELAAELLQIFQAQAGGQQAAGSHRPQIVGVNGAQPALPGEHGGPTTETIPATVSKIIADERTNKLIVIASAKVFLRINDIVKRLDVPTNTNQVHVVYLSNADAEEVATVLNSLSQGTLNNQRRGNTNGASAAPPPTPTPPSGAPGQGASFTGQIKVTADKSTNALLVIASPTDYINLQNVIAQLDIRRRQVFIEGVIMEVKLTNENSHSVDFHGGYGFQNVTLPGTNSSTVPLIIGSEPTGGGTSLNVASLASLTGFLAGIQGPPIQIPGLNISLPAFGVIINALQKNSDVDVISTPHILTSDNNEAEIEVGETVPFQTAVSTAGLLGSLSGAAGTTGSTGTLGALGLGLGGLAPIQRQPVELRLKIKPHVNESDFVKLEIDEQIEDIASTDPVRGPTTSKRAVKTTVVAKDQTTIVIGGLIQERTTHSVSAFPILGEIPVLGYLFRNEDTTKERTNLLLFLTPYIIRDQSDFRAIFERKMKERQEFVARFFGANEEYASSVDYERKEGPLSVLKKTVDHEYQKAEQGGKGTSDEHVIMGTPSDQQPPGSQAPGQQAPGTQPGQQPSEPQVLPPSKPAAPNESTEDLGGVPLDDVTRELAPAPDVPAAPEGQPAAPAVPAPAPAPPEGGH